MASIQKILIQKQMDELIQSYVNGKQQVQTSVGWIQSIRLALAYYCHVLVITPVCLV